MILKMSESVKLSDDNHDKAPAMNTATNSTRGQFEGLKNLKREMDYRNSELGKTWSELSRIMYQYQSELIQKHDEIDSSLAPGERARITHLESVIDNSKNNVSKLEKRIADLEYKLLEKDSEIVRLRTEVHQLKNEVTMKDNLIQKIQNQMATEAMEYQNEIVSLKELLQVDSITSLVAESHTLGAKRRKTVKTSRASPQTFVSTDNSAFVKNEQALENLPPHNPPVFPSPQPVRRNGQPMDNESNDALASTSMSDSQQQDSMFYENSSQEDDNNSGEVMADHEGDPAASQSENRLLMDDVYGATGQQSQNALDMPYSIGQSQQALPHSADLKTTVTTYSCGIPNVPRPTGLRLLHMHGQQAMATYPTHSNQTDGQLPKQGLLTSDTATYSQFRMHRMCRQCNKLILAANYARHKRQHMGIHPFYCSICKRTFSLTANGIRHVQLVHHILTDANNFIIRRQGPGMGNPSYTPPGVLASPVQYPGSWGIEMLSQLNAAGVGHFSGTSTLSRPVLSLGTPPGGSGDSSLLQLKSSPGGVSPSSLLQPKASPSAGSRGVENKGEQSDLMMQFPRSSHSGY